MTVTVKRDPHRSGIQNPEKLFLPYRAVRNVHILTNLYKPQEICCLLGSPSYLAWYLLGRRITIKDL